MAESIPLKSLIPNLDPSEFKLHCAVWNNVDQPLDVFARSRDEWAGWNAWRGKRNDFNRQFIFSMMNYYQEDDRWLFGGIFEVLARHDEPNSQSYEIKLREDLLPGHIGRLKLGFPNKSRTIRRNFENVIDQIEVVEILASPYSGIPFPGLNNINVSLRELQMIASQQRDDWRGALRHMKGVYAIHDQTTGQAYVGSAYSKVGLLWARWGQYSANLHGNNVKLRELAGKMGSEYMLKNMRFSLLEFWSERTPDQEVLNRETYWKEVLLTRTFGLNGN